MIIQIYILWRKMMKKALVFCAFMILFSTLVFASGQQGQAPSGSGLTKLIWYFPPPGGYVPTDPSILAKIRAKIAAEVNVDLDYIAGPLDGTEAFNKLNLMLAAGDQVDLFTQNWEPFQASGAIMEIGP